MTKERIIATPSKTAFGFTKGKQYEFVSDESSWSPDDIPSLLVTYDDKQRLQIESRDILLRARKSAHLWGGERWDRAGHWKLVSHEVIE